MEKENDWIKFYAVILPTKEIYQKTCIPEIWDNTREGDLFNCVDINNPEKTFKVVKIINRKVYMYPI